MGLEMSKQFALDELVKAIHEFRKFTHQPLTLRGGDYAAAIPALNKATDRAEGLFAIFHTATGAEPTGRPPLSWPKTVPVRFEKCLN